MEKRRLMLLGTVILLIGILISTFGWKCNIDILILIGAILIAIGSTIIYLAKSKKEVEEEHEHSK